MSLRPAIAQLTKAIHLPGGSASRASAARPRIKPSRPVYCVYNKTQETFLGLCVGRADTQWSRLRGLLGRLKLRTGEGMWVLPSVGIHTIGMLFPIDLVYLDGRDRVVYLVEHLTPFRISRIRLKSESVLQLPIHTIYNSQTRPGDELIICEPHEIKTHLMDDAQKNARPPGTRTREGDQ